MTVANHEEEAAILDAVGKWLERDVRPHVLELEHADTYPAEMVEQMKALGLFGATIAHRATAGSGSPPPPTPRSCRRSRRCGCRSPASSTRT